MNYLFIKSIKELVNYAQWIFLTAVTQSVYCLLPHPRQEEASSRGEEQWRLVSLVGAGPWVEGVCALGLAGPFAWILGGLLPGSARWCPSPINCYSSGRHTLHINIHSR